MMKTTAISEGTQISPGQLIMLAFTLAFGAALGGLLATFLAPGSDLALLVGSGVFPTVMLAGGFLVEELWFLRLWQHQPHRWHLAIEDSSASPEILAERERSAVFLPLGAVGGAIGGTVVGLAAPVGSILASVLLYASVGLGFGGVVYTLVQFSALPHVDHGKEVPPHSAHRAKSARYHHPRFDDWRPEF